MRHDVPIRIFDALLTGGVPIVPNSLKYHPAIIDVQNHIQFYLPEDISDPHKVTKGAIEKFEGSGQKGMLERSRYAFENCHVDAHVTTILGRAL